MVVEVLLETLFGDRGTHGSYRSGFDSLYIVLATLRSPSLGLRRLPLTLFVTGADFAYNRYV